MHNRSQLESLTIRGLITMIVGTVLSYLSQWTGVAEDEANQLLKLLGEVVPIATQIVGLVVAWYGRWRVGRNPKLSTRIGK